MGHSGVVLNVGTTLAEISIVLMLDVARLVTEKPVSDAVLVAVRFPPKDFQVTLSPPGLLLEAVLVPNVPERLLLLALAPLPDPRPTRRGGALGPSRA